MSQTFGIALPLQLENNGYFGTNKDLLRQLRSNLKNLILTKKGERLSQPEFGCDIWKYLFEPIENRTREQIYTSIIDAVEMWMPFLEIIDVNLQNTTDDVGNNKIGLSVLFRLRTNQNIQDLINLTL